MTKKKPAKKTAKKKPAPPGPLSRWWEENGADFSGFMRRFTLKLLLWGLFLGGSVAGLRYLDGYVQHSAQDRKVLLTPKIINPPIWAREDLIEQVRQSCRIASDEFLLEKDLVKTWTANLLENPWVKHVDMVRKCYDGQVLIKCQLRRPVACVEQGGKYYFVDIEGVVLPEMPVKDHLVALQGDVLKLPEPGQMIQSDAMKAGLQVLALIRQFDRQLPREQRLWMELGVVDVSNFEGRLDRKKSHLTLYTRKDTQIFWGAAVGREGPYYEAPAMKKLETLYETYKQLDSLDQCKWVELRDWRKNIQIPLRQG